MKQSMIDKVCNNLLKEVGTESGWKSSKGFLFKKKCSLFFTIYNSARIKIPASEEARKVEVTLSYKWYDFDDVFWKIVRMEENAKLPLSFHAAGVWTAPLSIITEITFDHGDWCKNPLKDKLSSVVKTMEQSTERLSQTIITPSQNLNYLKSLHKQFLQVYPGSTRNICTEELLTAILEKNNQLALKIAQERIDHNDPGKFTRDGKSFYELAKEYIESLARVIGN